MPAPIVPAPATPITVGASTPLLMQPYLPWRPYGSRRDERVYPRQRAADDQLLDLRGALIQGGHAHIAEIPLDRVIVDVSRASVNLDRRVDRKSTRLNSSHLGISYAV